MNKEIKDFRQRIKNQKEDSQLYRSMGGAESGEAWNVFTGDYTYPIFKSEFGSPTVCGSEDSSGRERPEELLGVEITLKKVIEHLLKEKQSMPVIAFDYGGGVGVSWCRLALNFSEEIVSGKLILVVSNIERNYVPSFPVIARFHQSDLRTQAFNLAKKNNLVQWIVAEPESGDRGSVYSLRQYKLKGHMPLNHNVDLLFSRMSLIHSHIPDFHLHRLIELLSDTGVFIEASSSGNLPTLGDDENIQTSGGSTQRKKEVFALSYKDAITFYDLEKINKVEIGPNKGKPTLYTILRKKNSLPSPIWA